MAPADPRVGSPRRQPEDELPDDVRDVVDPPGHHPRHRRPGAHHPHVALVQELGREPASEEIAKRMDIPVSKVRKVLKIAQEPISRS